MLSQAQRTTILELHAQGVTKREIARVLRISRLSVRKVLRSNSTAVPEIAARRESRALPATDPGAVRPRARAISCESMRNWWRAARTLSYPALTAFCRRHGIGHDAASAPRASITLRPARRCSTTPRRTRSNSAGKKRKVQTASAVLCYSRMLFFQCYPTFQRFDCKVFLTDALRYYGRRRRNA